MPPWAEIVPTANRMTVADLLAMPDDGWQYEVVDGVLVRVARSSFRATAIAARLLVRLGVFVEDHGLGTVTGADGVYDFENTGQRDTGLIPDVGFFHAFRRPLVENDKPIPFAPDLAAEVVSPTQSAGDMAAKAQRYLAGGTSLVWVLWPARQTIDVWHPGDDTPSAILGIGDLLSGGDIVTGFNYPVAALFAV